MPSTNATIMLSAQRRIVVNKCEGEVTIQYQTASSDWHWTTFATIDLDEGQADRLAKILAGKP
jgi:hypothetical protein